VFYFHALPVFPLGIECPSAAHDKTTPMKPDPNRWGMAYDGYQSKAAEEISSSTKVGQEMQLSRRRECTAQETWVTMSTAVIEDFEIEHQIRERRTKFMTDIRLFKATAKARFILEFQN
jgi:hypothetical protein